MTRPQHVTAVHKANIMKLGDGLFLNTCRRVAEEYKDSGITFSDMMWVAALSTRGCHPRKLTRETDSPGSVDNTSMQLVNRPQQFDVMVMPNLYGSIVSNIGAALVGGPGIVPGANIGREYALFEPGCRHVAKDIQGQDVANPAAMVLSSTMVSSLRALISFLVLVGRGSRIVDGEPRPPRRTAPEAPRPRLPRERDRQGDVRRPLRGQDPVRPPNLPPLWKREVLRKQ